jgi:hypothetical protein
MSVISSVNFLVLADSIAWTQRLFLADCGTGTETDTSSEAGLLNKNRVLALGDYDQELELLAGFGNTYSALNYMAIGGAAFPPAIKALNAHVSGIDNFLTNNAVRVDPYFKGIFESIMGNTLSAANSFSPVVDPMATFVCSGPGAGTYTHGTAIDSSKYYAANLTLVVMNAPIISSGVVSITCKKWDGTTEIKTVNVTSGMPAGTTIDVGTHPTDKYKDITNITLSGCDATDTIKIKSELERVVVK